MAVNLSNPTFTFNLKIAQFDIHPKALYPVFLAGVLIYVFSVLCNGAILGLIITQRSLHKPMFYILFSLPLTDLIGITSALPRVLVDILTETNDVYYPTCVLQAFLLHLYGGSIPFLLAAMSVDRYIAICNPLRYNSIMTPCKICGIIVLAWGVDFALILVLFSLHSRMEKCKSFISNVYCDNPSLLLLSCERDFTVNNIYGLFITAFMQVSSISVQLFSYTHILITCIKQTHADSKVKALNTCIAQIATFFLFEIVTTVAILSYRIPSISSSAQRICGLMIYTVLPTVNPVIYGMKTKDIRIAFFMVWKSHKVSPGKNTSDVKNSRK
ncbi:putative gustatory receptor clone PTE01 [Carassius carassius]|uniref:putative gustatory receptor clone PTE01 n=1 Tax=Carassius carassius TaxID=217509 RepID=UPI002868D5BD|nr:putative gustatory receptor clone PTE01 [Carassius carassius]